VRQQIAAKPVENSMDDTPPCAQRDNWNYFESQQERARNSLLSYSRRLSSEDKLDFVLSKIEAGQVVEEERAEQLERNRSRKYRRRQGILLTKYLAFSDLFDDGTAAESQAILNERIEWVKKHTSEFEWDLLWRIANGSTTAQLSVDLAIKSSTIRSTVSRCRARLQGLASAA